MALDRDAIYARAARIAAARPHPGDIVDRDRERALRSALLDRDLPDHIMIGAGPKPAVQRAMSDRERSRVRLIRLSARDLRVRIRQANRLDQLLATERAYVEHHSLSGLDPGHVAALHHRLKAMFVRTLLTSAPPAALRRAGAPAAA